MIKALYQPLQEIAEFEELKMQIQKAEGFVELSGCLDSQKAHMAKGLTPEGGAAILVAENELKAKNLYEDMRLFDPDVMFLPRRDLIFYQADLSGNLITRQRIQVIKTLMEQKKGIIVTSAGGCMDYLLPVRVLEKNILNIMPGDDLDLDHLSDTLAAMGYEREVQVEAPGQFAIRGGIVDIYALTEDSPWRIELFDTEVDDIRRFEPETQRTFESNIESIAIYPATEEIGRDDAALSEGNTKKAEEAKAYYRRLTDTIFDYLPEGSIVFVDEPQRVLENAKAISVEYQEAMKHRLEDGQIDPIQTQRMMTEDQLAYEFDKRNCVALSLMEQHHLPMTCKKRFQITARSVNSYNNQLPTLFKDLQSWKRKGYRVVLLSASRTRGERLAAQLRDDEGLNAVFSEEQDRGIQNGEVLITKGSIRRGFEYPLQKFVLITDSDIFGAEQKKKRHKKQNSNQGERIRDFSQIMPGDYVVHENHGLGVYKGIEKVEVDHTTRDFIKIEYSGGSNLYVPATQLDMLQKYAGAEGHKPKINRLGGKEWDNTKSRVKGAVQNIARDLVMLYAARADAKGYQYGPDTIWQREFEEMFPFEETEDQLQAIEDTKRDMESTKVMDRLVCGDVGYGKTEIAIRAAFKAAQESRQVVLLCPTTILAQQHYNTFVERMKDYPVKIDLLSRFRTPAQQKKTLEGVRKGEVDILIGTHRVLSKDIKYKNLGLLIIDEEQRFGVVHKEKIKKMRENIDVLTLTATPIPRTLHMSMIGIRDMSVLEEPPLDRIPIQTYVMEYDDEMIREAISRELSRDGQVFLVYNRVKGIQEMAARVQELVPDANVAYAHGKMKETELEDVMYGFINHDIDVLVSTTIIETGVDISNANTLIITDADRLGLSQLYQLRGRVGRSNRNAYAFLMYKKDKMLKEEAEKRLHAIREFTELGSGVKIAMRDLEIRGAGNVLGAEQSGHMEAVGYDLYCKMLAEAVKRAKGIVHEEDFETSVDLTISAYIPASYIEDEGQKLDVYKRIAGIENSDEEQDMLDELIDRFGDVPTSVMNLIRVSRLKVAAHRAFITEIKQQGEEIRITLYNKAKLDAAALPELVDRQVYRNRLLFRASGDPYFIYKLRSAAEKKPTHLFKRLDDFITDLQGLRLEPVETTDESDIFS